MNFYGREDLLVDLDALWGKGLASLVTCRGRRRIGKSTLIHKFAERSGARYIKIEGLRPEPGFSNEHELAAFADQLSQQVGRRIKPKSNWLDSFKRLSDSIDDRRTVVLLDEVSWMAYYDETFAAILKVAWDNFFKIHDHLILVICGSVSTWIKERIIDNKAYFGRRSLDMIVPELPLKECVRFWRDRVDKIPLREIIDVLSVTGGVPRYLEEVNPSLSATENLRQMAFRPNATLRVDFDEMFEDVITRNTKLSARVLEALSDGPLTVTEIAALFKMEKNGHLSEALDQLVESGMVSPDVGKNPETGADVRERRYRLRDNYSRFYLKCIKPYKSVIDDGSFAFTALNQFQEWSGVHGLAFENLVVNHYRELLPFLHLGDTAVFSAAPYRKTAKRKGEGFQIDLLIQTRRSLCVVEIKRKKSISKGVVDDVNRKIARLKRPRDCSVRAALVYDGKLPPAIPADGYFDAIVPFSALIGL